MITTFEVRGLKNLSFIKGSKPKIELAASRAINRTADRTRADSARQILSQVNFPASYVKSKTAKRLAVSKKASKGDLSAIIVGRRRVTSLARFATSITKRGVRVAVKPGGSKVIPQSFFLQLRQGSNELDTAKNQLLAVRMPKGKKPPTAYAPKQISERLWLLYGPSINQVFGGDRGVAQSVSPSAADFLAKEFDRLLKL